MADVTYTQDQETAEELDLMEVGVATELTQGGPGRATDADFVTPSDSIAP